jgi:hypothetical protein
MKNLHNQWALKVRFVKLTVVSFLAWSYFMIFLLKYSFKLYRYSTLQLLAWGKIFYWPDTVQYILTEDESGFGPFIILWIFIHFPPSLAFHFIVSLESRICTFLTNFVLWHVETARFQNSCVVDLNEQIGCILIWSLFFIILYNCWVTSDSMIEWKNAGYK